MASCEFSIAFFYRQQLLRYAERIIEKVTIKEVIKNQGIDFSKYGLMNYLLHKHLK